MNLCSPLTVPYIRRTSYTNGLCGRPVDERASGHRLTSHPKFLAFAACVSSAIIFF